MGTSCWALCRLRARRYALVCCPAAHPPPHHRNAECRCPRRRLPPALPPRANRRGKRLAARLRPLERPPASACPGRRRPCGVHHPCLPAARSGSIPKATSRRADVEHALLCSENDKFARSDRPRPAPWPDGAASLRAARPPRGFWPAPVLLAGAMPVAGSAFSAPGRMPSPAWRM